MTYIPPTARFVTKTLLEEVRRCWQALQRQPADDTAQTCEAMAHAIMRRNAAGTAGVRSPRELDALNALQDAVAGALQAPQARAMDM